MKKQNVFVYMAVFEPEDDAICVSFPDLPDVNTYGHDIAHAIEMAHEALYAYLDMCLGDGDKLPAPSAPEKIKTPAGGFASAVLVDIKAMMAKYSNKAVKKTLTIPEWLNSMAEAEDINFSKVLQDALKEKLGA